ncbi:MAG: metallophosphoesterase [Kiritimatiellae bacterium]|nr:metallophosphoesterase [Kiritimatiellia bacterium]
MDEMDQTPGRGASRRDFLKGGLALGGLVATSVLPSFADDPSLFPVRGRWERLSIGYQHINAGAEKRFAILHISDTHLTAVYPHESAWTRNFMARRSKTFGGRQEEALCDSLAWAKEHVDYVIHTGDLIDAQSEANLDLVRKYYGIGGSAMTGSLGNHEFYHGQKVEDEATKAVSRERLAKAYPFDNTLASTVVNGVNFVTLDNVYNTVTTDQATRFEAEVKKGLPIILCMHCPFGTPHITRCANRYWRRRDLKGVLDVRNWKPHYKDSVTTDFVAYLKAQRLLKGILAGHLHIDIQDRFSPTAMEFLVGGNFLFHGQEITIA